MAGGRLWNPEEDKYLIENYSNLGRKACAYHLKRSVSAVKCRAYELGIQADVKVWPEAEDRILEENYPIIGRTGCAKLLPHRTRSAIGVRAGLLGLTNDRRHKITRDDIEVIRVSYPHRGGRKRCAQLLPHLPPYVISHVAEKLGVLQSERNQWNDSENGFIRRNYANKGKHWCSQQLPGRTPRAVAFQARKLGLVVDPQSEYFKDWQRRAAASKLGRPKPGAAELLKRLRQEGRLPQPPHTSERRQKQAETMREWHALHGNPNRGKKLSDEVKRKMGAASRRRWNDPDYRAKMTTPERRERLRQISSENWFRSGRASENAYSRCNGGRRSDLGDMFFRSGWEANYARILNLMKEQRKIVRWEFEPERFKFPVNIKPLSYTPDFKVWRDDENYEYVEIKGRMDENSRTKHRLMDQFYPEVPIRIIDQWEYKRLQAEFSPRIEEWEFYSSRYIAKRKRDSVYRTQDTEKTVVLAL